MLSLNPHDWLDKDGQPPAGDPAARRKALRLARLIEYGGPLAPDEFRETLVECSRRPARKPCLGLLWVAKTEKHEILAYCPRCEKDEVLIQSWQDTAWAAGPMLPASLVLEGEARLSAKPLGELP
jgi:hypothetical protein